ncbi:uncharacterized protein B0H18DRAFT_1210973 [Fomitopsis serialis]|uniref:uncharacterized protein n=1 Tax=Fomitopsis serialis TaxID=139415 RepID=UPI002007F1E8|nr:uncharacterized protein B0H18DRAFT_1210973 [Neoantrodia serialis]KAH9926767.1 hypothetical protein B0H18DRAFT_1210973 [Neoantrodia serialis]
MDSASSGCTAQHTLEPQGAFVTSLDEEVITERPLYVADAGELPQLRCQGLYPDMSTAAPRRTVALGWHEPSAYSLSSAINLTSTRETHAVGTDALFFDTPSLDTPLEFFDTPSLNTPSLNTPSLNTPSLNTPSLNASSLYTPSFYASSFGNPSYASPFDFDHTMMSPFGTSQLGPAPDEGHQRCFSDSEPFGGNWPPSSSLRVDRPVRPIPQSVTGSFPSAFGGRGDESE